MEAWLINNENGLLVSFLAGLATALFIKTSSSVTEAFRFIFQTARSVDGHWISAFPGTDGDPVYEIIKVKSSKENVRISYQSYKFSNDGTMVVRSGAGVGNRKAGTIVCPYNRLNPPSVVIGTYLLNEFIYNQELCLVGHYIQRADDTEDSCYMAGTLAFIKISISVNRRLRTVFAPLFTKDWELKKYLSNEAKHIIEMSNKLRAELAPISQEQANKGLQPTPKTLARFRVG